MHSNLYPARRSLILVVRRERDFVVRNHRLFCNHPAHHFVNHHLTVLAASAEQYLACAAVVFVLIARPLLAFRAAQAPPDSSRRLCRFGF